MSVSGNSPNLVKAIQWARDHGLETVALVGAKRGLIGGTRQQVIVVGDTHYGRVEDAQMGILHMATPSWNVRSWPVRRLLPRGKAQVSHRL